MIISNVYFCNNIYNIKHMYEYLYHYENWHEVPRLTARQDYRVHVKVTRVHVKIARVHEVHATDQHVSTKYKTRCTSKHEVHEV